MDLPSCPICNHNASRLWSFSVSELVSRYWDVLSIDVGREFGDLVELHLNQCPTCDLRFFSPAITGSEEFYRLLQKNSWYYRDDKPEFATASGYIKSTDLLLDVGCGGGAFARGHPVNKYVGLEFSYDAVQKARAKKLTVFQESIESHAVATPAFYDVVCAFQVLEHVSDQRVFIEACIDTCRYGGKIIFSTPNADSFADAVKNSMLNFPPHHTARFTRRLWTALPRFFPLRMIEVVDEQLDPIHYKLYTQTLIQSCIERLLPFRRSEYIDSSYRHRLVRRISQLVGRCLLPGLADPRLRPKGQAITAIYEKIGPGPKVPS